MLTKKHRLVFKGLGLVVVVAIAFWLATLASENVAVQSVVATYGYLGIFFLALISGFNFVVPIPAVAFMPLFIESGLLLWPTVLVIAVGMTSADMLGYLLARMGKGLVSDSWDERAFSKLSEIKEKHPKAPLIIFFFFAALAPLPNEVMIIPLVLFGYRFVELAPIALAGNLIFTSLFAHGALGIFEIL